VADTISRAQNLRRLISLLDCRKSARSEWRHTEDRRLSQARRKTQKNANALLDTISGSQIIAHDLGPHYKAGKLSTWFSGESWEGVSLVEAAQCRASPTPSQFRWDADSSFLAQHGINADHLEDAETFFNRNCRTLTSMQLVDGALRPVPLTLLSAIHIQAAEALMGNQVWRHCKNPSCHKSFQLGPGLGSTKRRNFCDGTCRQRYNRAMIAEAVV
jgi:hypothetical protein